MTILDAALNSDVYHAARLFLEAGVSVIPVNGKLPTLKKWVNFQKTRASLNTVDFWETHDLLHGVAVVCGQVSRNLVVLDLDSDAAIQDFVKTWPLLVETLIVFSGSGRGAHFYYYSNQLPPSTVAPSYELRANGLYVVAPPSLHPSGKPYTVAHPVEPLQLHHMKGVVDWIKAKRPTPPAAQEKTPTAPTPRIGPTTSREEYFRERYVSRALVLQVERVTFSIPKNRNHQLYYSSVALGQLVGAGALSRSRAETELLIAARTCGLTDAESVKTIKSGLDAGEKKPRTIPPPPPKPNNSN